MTAIAVRTTPARPLVMPAVIVSLLLVAAGTGPVVPLVPIAAVAGLAIVLAIPMRWSAAALLVVALVADNPGERPMDGKWKSPLYPLGALLYENLHKHTGIGALRFSALEALVALLLVIAIARKWRRDPIDDPLALGALPNPMKHAFALLFGTILFLEAYGLARGGDFRNSLWQARQLVWLPLLGVLFGNAFKTAGARAAVLWIILAAAWVRSLVGIYFSYAIARPGGMNVEYAMTHSDSVLLVVAVLVGLFVVIDRPTPGHAALNLVLQPVLLMGLMVNDRRLAFVGLGAGLVALVLMGPAHLWRWLTRGAIVLIPAALLYVAVGWNSSSPVFKPVETLRSVTAKKDASSQTRDIENYNLIQTLKRNPLLGSGFGHEYVELVQANRVDQYFAQYKYIAHNSVLWLLSLSGWVGFALVWSAFPVSAAVALSVHRSSRTLLDRTVAFATVAALLCFIVQAWGDMGLQSWMGSLVLTSLIGATGSLFTARQHPGVSA